MTFTLIGEDRGKEQEQKVEEVAQVPQAAPAEEVEQIAGVEELDQLEKEEKLKKVEAEIKALKKKSSKKKEEPKESLQVVRELPTQQVRQYTSEDGTKVHLITIEEALTQIINNIP